MFGFTLLALLAVGAKTQFQRKSEKKKIYWNWDNFPKNCELGEMSSSCVWKLSFQVFCTSLKNEISDNKKCTFPNNNFEYIYSLGGITDLLIL